MRQGPFLTLVTTLALGLAACGDGGGPGGQVGGGSYIADAGGGNKCAADGVLVCEGFADQAAVDAAFRGREWTRPAIHDPRENAAKLYIPSLTPADTSGSLYFTFPAVRRGDPGEQHIWVQFRVKYPQAFLDQVFYSDQASGQTTGWKTSVMWGGDASCSAHEFALTGPGHIGGYTRCGDQNLQLPHPVLTAIEQPGGDTACIYRNANPRDCLHHRGDTWGTFTYHINLDRYLAEIWVKYENDPVLYKIMQLTLPGQPEDLFYDHIYLSAYMTGKDPKQQHRDLSIWYDDLIVSSRPIALPLGEAAIPAYTASRLTPVVLVDFGASEAQNHYGTELTRPFHDAYESYTPAGGGGIQAGEQPTYNHSGVMGRLRDYQAGEKIRVTFYNATDSELEVWPTLSFQHGDRGGDPHLMSQARIPAHASGFSEYRFTALSAGRYPAVNLSVYPQGLVVDRIEHWVLRP